MEEVQPQDYQLGTAEYSSRCILYYMVLLHVFERFGIDLTWCGCSTAHGGVVWPHHIIISTLFVTAVFAVKMWWLGKCVLFWHISVLRLQVLRAERQVIKRSKNCLRPHQWTACLRSPSASLFGRTVVYSALNHLSRLLAWEYILFIFYFSLRSFQTDDNIEFSVVCKYLIYDHNQQYVCQKKWQDAELSDPCTEWTDQVTVVQCCL
jgi:hypothetical protein